MGKTFIRISLLVVAATGITGIFAGTLARKFLGIEELVPTPTFQLRSEELFHIGPLPVTNTILSSWLVTALLVLVLGLAMGPPGRFLPRLRNAVEMLLEYLLDLFERVAGKGWSAFTFTFVLTLFLFVVANAWITLLPIYGPVRIAHPGGAAETVPLLRGAGTDINMPLALAILASIFVELHTLRIQGRYYFQQILPLGNFARGHLAAGVGELYLAMLHNLSRITRVLSFSFRLFGALTAGELLRLMITFLTPFLLVVPFYGMEILLGLLQALVFAGLTLILLVVAQSGPDDSGTGRA